MHKPVRLVQEFLERSAERLPDKIALVCDEHRLSYAQLEAQANRLAHALRARGVQPGDRVAFYLPNCVELVIGIYATLKAGGVFVVVNHTTKQDKLSYILNNCQAAALVTWHARRDIALQCLRDVPSLRFGALAAAQALDELPDRIFAWDDLLASGDESRLPPSRIDQDLACLIYTSGSTGEPKGVMSAHANVVFAVQSITEYLQNVEDDVVINVLPLSFDYGLYQLLMTFAFGGRLVLEKGFTYAALILKRMQEERVTGFPAVPTIFSVLLPMDLSAYDLSSLRYATNTAAALPVTVIERIRAKFPAIRMYSMYGLTETKRTLYLPPEQIDTRPASVGIAIPGTEAWLEDDAGNRLSANQTGELVVRGRHVMRGYWADPAMTAIRFRPGVLEDERYCYTGDLFRMDEEGYFYFVARRDDIIKSRGEKVAPKEVESVLYRMQGVRDAAVIGIPDEMLGQAIKAFIVTDGRDMNQGDVLRFCRANLEDFMIPKVVEFRADLPLTSSGKIKKTDLR